MSSHRAAGPLDRLPAPTRHLALLLLAAALTWADQDLLPIVVGLDLPVGLGALAAAALTAVIAWATPLTRQYGAGSRA